MGLAAAWRADDDLVRAEKWLISSAWCGSVWLCSEEDIANQAIKAKFITATSNDTLRSPTRTGKPARQLRTAWHDEWERPGSPASLPMPLQPLLVNETVYAT